MARVRGPVRQQDSDHRGRPLGVAERSFRPKPRGVAVEGYRRAQADVNVEVVAFQSELVDAALTLYGARSDKGWSLTDCFSFVVMERRHLTEALTTDRHFEQANLKARMPEQPAG